MKDSLEPVSQLLIPHGKKFFGVLPKLGRMFICRVQSAYPLVRNLSIYRNFDIYTVETGKGTSGRENVLTLNEVDLIHIERRIVKYMYSQIWCRVI